MLRQKCRLKPFRGSDGIRRHSRAGGNPDLRGGGNIQRLSESLVMVGWASAHRFRRHRPPSAVIPTKTET
ncbi:hypothetical protein NEILACOT_04238 [Neisseria lactamica ATCC 23970]|uniref:Uncharacterized protein n=1 Tax=Neisseria lactamica ATCC 23970 TaxID=546265 RepID=D0W9M6_NEILA|nr:hypothetical protein NEILACOT_04238 [Neisseria lactamica ATCC 23970]